MVTDEQILSGLETLLNQADFSVTTSGDIRQQLEHKLGVDLSHKRAFIREHIDLIVQSKRIPFSPQQLQQQHHQLHQQQQQQQLQRQHQHQRLHQLQHQHQPQQPQFHHLPHAHGHGGVAVGIPSYGDLVDMPAFDPKANYGCSVKVDIPQGSVVPEVSKDSAAQVQNSTPTGSKRKGGAGGLNKLCGVSPELQVIVGEPAMPRTQIVKQLWAYIRKNNLQDPSNKRKIICNDALRLVFETDCTDMFKMNKLLAKHILPLEPTKDAAPDPKRLKATTYSDSQTQGDSPGSVPVIMSEALTNFFGNGERELPQPEALKRIWNYIQMNHLEDPSNSVVICDYRLRELFNCETFAVGNLPEMLSHHFLKR